MCEALRELMKDEIEAEKRESEKKGAFDAMLFAIKNFVMNAGVTPEEAMKTLGVAAADQSKYMAKL